MVDVSRCRDKSWYCSNRKENSTVMCSGTGIGLSTHDAVDFCPVPEHARNESSKRILADLAAVHCGAKRTELENCRSMHVF